MYRLIYRVARKIKIVIGFFVTRKIIAEYHDDGSPKTIIKYRGAEKYIRKIKEYSVK